MSKAGSQSSIINVIIAGLGGQGVILASDLLSEAAFRDGQDVKKAEVHGMSQRGGSVNSDIRFGPQVLSPMVPDGEADFLLVLEPTQVDPNRHRIRPAGRILSCTVLPETALPNPKTLNVAMLGVLSAFLPISAAAWESAMAAVIPAKILEVNTNAFRLGRAVGEKERSHA